MHLGVSPPRGAVRTESADSPETPDSPIESASLSVRAPAFSFPRGGGGGGGFRALYVGDLNCDDPSSSNPAFGYFIGDGLILTEIACFSDCFGPSNVLALVYLSSVCLLRPRCLRRISRLPAFHRPMGRPQV